MLPTHTLTYAASNFEDAQELEDLFENDVRIPRFASCG